jgi:hypothetical protein
VTWRPISSSIVNVASSADSGGTNGRQRTHCPTSARIGHAQVGHTARVRLTFRVSSAEWQFFTANVAPLARSGNESKYLRPSRNDSRPRSDLFTW